LNQFSPPFPSLSGWMDRFGPFYLGQMQTFSHQHLTQCLFADRYPGSVKYVSHSLND
jgi:hypothetical protein